RVRRGAQESEQDLRGRRLAQVPLHTLTFGLDWRPAERWRFDARGRHVSQAFEDDGNQLTLAPATTVDLRLAYTLGRTRAGEVFLAVENVGNETIEAGRDVDGRVDLGQPRFAHGGIHWRW